MIERKFTFKIGGPLPGKVQVIFTDDMVETAKRFDYEKGEAKTLWGFANFNKGATLVLTYNANMPTIVHECAHITFWLMEYAGVPVTSEENEAFCYTLDYIFAKICKLQKKANYEKVII